MIDWFSLLRPWLFLLSPEAAHHVAITALRLRLLPRSRSRVDPVLSQRVLGLDFAHPIGLAAGFDKNAEALCGVLGQGFSFVEAGTVTPLPQVGNPTPRLFRLSEDQAIINRMGFNNGGLESFTSRLRARRPAWGIVGANIGKNKDSVDAVRDYEIGLRAVYPLADYITVNISSPNTPGLRNLQKHEALDALLASLATVRASCADEYGKHAPLLVKVAPDLAMDEKEAIVAAALAHRIDGLIVSNTTISRPWLRSPLATEAGGLSGRPLFALSTEALRDFYRLSGGKLTLIGVGGVASAEDAYAKILAGASLVQLYSALVYQGFGLIREIVTQLPALLKRDGFTSLSQAIGAGIKEG